MLKKKNSEPSGPFLCSLDDRSTKDDRSEAVISVAASIFFNLLNITQRIYSGFLKYPLIKPVILNSSKAYISRDIFKAVHLTSISLQKSS